MQVVDTIASIYTCAGGGCFLPVDLKNGGRRHSQKYIRGNDGMNRPVTIMWHVLSFSSYKHTSHFSHDQWCPLTISQGNQNIEFGGFFKNIIIGVFFKLLSQICFLSPKYKVKVITSDPHLYILNKRLLDWISFIETTDDNSAPNPFFRERQSWIFWKNMNRI